jgi:putative Mn2+ efflux pump MntP
LHLLELIIVALALSMDAFAVTAANVVSHHSAPWRRLLAMPMFFGLFQGLMPCIGYLVGGMAAGLIERYAGFVAFAILAFIGGRMAWDGWQELRGGSAATQDGDAAAADDAQASGTWPAMSAKPLSYPSLLLQAVATSIDALMVGVSFVALHVNVAAASAMIAATTAACCLAALWLGRRFGAILGKRAEVLGGLTLVAIGVKALFG